jgi:hypothetical protein
MQKKGNKKRKRKGGKGNKKTETQKKTLKCIMIKKLIQGKRYPRHCIKGQEKFFYKKVDKKPQRLGTHSLLAFAKHK